MKKILKHNSRIGSLLSFIIASIIIGLPTVAFANSLSAGFTTLGGVINTFTSTVVKAAGSLFVAAGVVAFFYGMVNFIFAVREGDAAKIKSGRMFMVWGLIGVFVMVSVWGIVVYFQTIFGIQNQTDIVIPQMRISGAAGGATASGGTEALPVASYSHEESGSVPISRVAPIVNGAGTAGADCATPGSTSECQSGLECGTTYKCVGQSP